MAFIPEDRQRDALALSLPLYQNVALRGLGTRRGIMRWPAIVAETDRVIQAFDVRAEGPGAPADTLSGGNQQKLVLGRELADSPDLVVVENPTPTNPLGVKGAGESGMVGTPAAISNAVADALEIGTESPPAMPLTPHRVREFLRTRAARPGR